MVDGFDKLLHQLKIGRIVLDIKNAAFAIVESGMRARRRYACGPTLDPILPRLEPGRPGRKGHRDPAALESQRRALARMQIPVEVQIARGVLPLSEVAQLKVGDVVKLDSQKGDPAVVFLGGRPKYLGRPGLRGRKRAVEIEAEIAPEEEDHYT